MKEEGKKDKASLHVWEGEVWCLSNIVKPMEGEEGGGGGVVTKSQREKDNVLFVWRDWCVLGLWGPQSDCRTRDSLSDLGTCLFILSGSKLKECREKILLPPLVTTIPIFKRQGVRKKVTYFQEKIWNTSLFPLRSAFLKNVELMQK